MMTPPPLPYLVCVRRSGVGVQRSGEVGFDTTSVYSTHIREWNCRGHFVVCDYSTVLNLMIKNVTLR